MYTVESVDNLNQFIVSRKHKIIALYFGASWCGPCQKLKEQFKNDVVMNQFKSLEVVYVNIDNDNLSDIVESYKIESLPTVFMTMLKEDQVVVLDKIIGYNWSKFVQSYVKNIELLSNYLDLQNNTVEDNTVEDNTVEDNTVVDNSVVDNSLVDNSLVDNTVVDNSVEDNTIEDNDATEDED